MTQEPEYLESWRNIQFAKRDGFVRGIRLYSEKENRARYNQHRRIHSKSHLKVMASLIKGIRRGYKHPFTIFGRTFKQWWVVLALKAKSCIYGWPK